MTVKTWLANRVHGVLCQTGKVPQPDWGCCGCGAPAMDVYITVGCDYCKAAGEGFCWSCVDGVEDWPADLTLADFTVLPGRERPNAGR